MSSDILASVGSVSQAISTPPSKTLLMKPKSRFNIPLQTMVIMADGKA